MGDENSDDTDLDAPISDDSSSAMSAEAAEDAKSVVEDISQDEDEDDFVSSDESDESDHQDDDVAEWPWEELQQWTSDCGGFPQQQPFTHIPGFKPGIWDATTKSVGLPEHHPLNYLEVWWPHTVYDILAQRTNNYAEKRVAANKLKKWRKTDSCEMQGFHAAIIYMGIRKHQDGIKSYFVDDTWGSSFVHSMFTYD